MIIRNDTKVMVVGYGSIGKRHVKNLLLLGIKPVVITRYPDSAEVIFGNDISKFNDIQYAIIATPTGQHLEDFKKLATIHCKNVLIEKPVELTTERAIEIQKISSEKKINTFVAYNLRFLQIFDTINHIINKYKTRIRIVYIEAGQYLPDWRPQAEYRNSYSAHRDKGGGVDLDLSHEIDYMLWLFGIPGSIDYLRRYKISSLDIDSPDYFRGIYNYDNFIVEVVTDYIRPKERFIKILGENEELLYIDFINRTGRSLDGDNINQDDFNFETAYVEELKEFLKEKPGDKLSSLESGIRVMEMLRLED